MELENRLNNFLPSILSEVSSLLKKQAKKYRKLSVLEKRCSQQSHKILIEENTLILNTAYMFI